MINRRQFLQLTRPRPEPRPGPAPLTCHEMTLNLLRQDPATAWVFAVPGGRVTHKQCDQVSEEFRKAGIGFCMSGNQAS